jgi:hypothetical protein
MAVDTGAGASSSIDPTKPAKYPIILSDALRGKPATEIFTGIRFNHQPALSSETAPDIAKLQPSPSSSADPSSQSFDLSFTDDATTKGAYEYSGTRATDANQYVLYFDAARQAFILDRVDSVFSMNVTRAPECADADALAQQFEHLDTTVPPIPTNEDPIVKYEDDADDGGAVAAADPTPASTQESTATTTTKTATKTTKKTAAAKTVSPAKKGKAAAGGQTAAARKRAEKEKEKEREKAVAAPKTAAKKETAASSKAKQPATKKAKGAAAAAAPAASTTKAAEKPVKPVELLLPEPAPPAPALPTLELTPPPTISLPPAESPKRSSRRRSDSPDDEDSDDDDGGLLVEYPDAPGGAQGDTALANNFSPAFQIPQRQWSELLNRDGEDADGENGDGAQHAGGGAHDNDGDDGGDDGDVDDDDDMNAEYEDDDDADVHELQLPSPVGGRPVQDRQELQQSFEFDDGEEEEGGDGGAGDAELDEDLAAELEAELAESEVSEED